MNFKIYEIISFLVPGYLVLFLFKSNLGLEVKDMNSFAVIALAFAVGFIIQIIASWSEDILNLSWGGKPSTQLLDGKDMWKVRFYSSQKVRSLLVEEARRMGTNDPTSDHLFQIAYTSVTSKGYQRVEDFNANYAFARSMLIGLLVVLVKYATMSPFVWKYVLAILFGFLITWYRTKQRGFYFAREVLKMYLINVN